MKPKKVLLGAVSTIALISAIGAASAADMPTKGPVVAPAPLPVASWTGFYIGGNIGAGRLNTTFNFLTEAGVCGDGGGSSCSTNASGVIGGVQAGYNWQTSANTVFGVEGD